MRAAYLTLAVMVSFRESSGDLVKAAAESLMLIKRIRAAGLLSFGPEGFELPLQRLNVLIGPNGSGKSNLIDLIALIQASPRNLQEPLKNAGPVQDWLWRGRPPASEGVVEVAIDGPLAPPPLRHTITLANTGPALLVAGERIDHEPPNSVAQPYHFYNFDGSRREIREWSGASLSQAIHGGLGTVRQLAGHLTPDQSIIQQLRDPEHYPVLTHLQEAYAGIRIYRNWVLGPLSPLRRPQIAAGPVDFVEEDFSNYQRVVWNLRKHALADLLDYLADLYDGVEDFHLDPLGDTVLLSVRERDAGYLPVTRLSDGTLRYLCLLAILLSPSPPRLIVIDEPDIGLHPDLMPTLAKLLVAASERTQVLVITHSRALVDALSDSPEAIVVCGKDEHGTFFERLEPEDLARWLDRYSLGELWSRGEIGGNRW